MVNLISNMANPVTYSTVTVGHSVRFELKYNKSDENDKLHIYLSAIIMKWSLSAAPVKRVS